MNKGGVGVPTAAFYTLGCKVNQYESEAMMDLFVDRGYEIIDFSKKADVYIINSCTVTNQAASKTRKYARRAYRRNPESVVAVVGCYPQVSPGEVAEIDEVDLTIGTDNKKEIVDIIESNLKQDRSVESVITPYEELKEYEDLQLREVRETTRANIKIQEGCNQFCSFCIIPYARGPLRSRAQDSVLKEVLRLGQAGVREVILTGIHLGAYGMERNQEGELEELLSRLLSSDYEGRIRLSSIEVTEVSDQLLNLLGHDKVCSHLHLPLQSGSNSILEAMNRPYTSEFFKNRVKEIKKIIPDIAITTDVIVGFPGETENDFQKTKQLIEQVGFSRMHVFTFSAREGTPAADMSDQVASRTKNSRSQKLRRINKRLRKQFQQKLINRTQEILVEEKRDPKTGLLNGLTGNYVRILAEGEDSLKGRLLEVKIQEQFDFQKMKGIIVKKKDFTN